MTSAGNYFGFWSGVIFIQFQPPPSSRWNRIKLKSICFSTIDIIANIPAYLKFLVSISRGGFFQGILKLYWKRKRKKENNGSGRTFLEGFFFWENFFLIGFSTRGQFPRVIIFRGIFSRAMFSREGMVLRDCHICGWVFISAKKL